MSKPEKLPTTLRQVLDLVSKHPEGLERSDVAKALGVSYFAARYRLDQLHQLGLIRRRVEEKWGYRRKIPGLTPELQKIVGILLKHPEGLERSDVAEQAGVSYGTATRRLEELHRLGHIDRKIEGKWGYSKKRKKRVWLRKYWYYPKPPKRIKLRKIWFHPKLYYRLQKCHLWYAAEPGKKTPTPYAMISVFTYTATPEKYSQQLFDSALEYVETVICTVGTAEGPLPSFGWPGTSYKVVAYEQEQVDLEECEYPFDDLRYYVAFYGVRSDGTWFIKGEYTGKLIQIAGKWTHMEDSAEAKRKPLHLPEGQTTIEQFFEKATEE